ncbi:ribosomal protein L15, partial [Vibrio parahaemolyticus EKP-028]
MRSNQNAFEYSCTGCWL